MKFSASVMRSFAATVFLSSTSCSALSQNENLPDAVIDVGVGEEISFCADCPVFVRVPNAPEELRPIRFVAKYELTWRHYLASVEEGACEPPSLKNHGPRIARRELNRYKFDWPAELTTDKDIQCYTDWLSKKSDLVAAIPTENEWIWFARAGVTTKFPWGDTFVPGNASVSFLTNEKAQKFRKPESIGSEHWWGAPKVGLFPPNRWGLYDIVGNMHELTTKRTSADERAKKNSDSSFSKIYREYGSATVKDVNWYSENIPDNFFEFEQYPLHKDGTYYSPFALRFTLLVKE